MAVVVIDTIKPKNQGTFPVVEAADVKVTNEKRLDAALNDKANQSDLTALQTAVAGKASQADLTALSETVAGKQAALTEEQLTACNSGITEALVTQIGTNTTAIAGKASAADLANTNAAVATKADASDVAEETASLQAQIDAIVTPVTQDAEVENARVGANGTSYQTLKARLDAEKTDSDNDLSDYADKVDLRIGSINKYVFTNMLNPAWYINGKLATNNGIGTSHEVNYYNDSNGATTEPILLSAGTYYVRLAYSSIASILIWRASSGGLDRQIPTVEGTTDYSFTITESSYICLNIRNINNSYTTYTMLSDQELPDTFYSYGDHTIGQSVSEVIGALATRVQSCEGSISDISDYEADIDIKIGDIDVFTNMLNPAWFIEGKIATVQGIGTSHEVTYYNESLGVSTQPITLPAGTYYVRLQPSSIANVIIWNAASGGYDSKIETQQGTTDYSFTLTKECVICINMRSFDGAYATTTMLSKQTLPADFYPYGTNAVGGSLKEITDDLTDKVNALTNNTIYVRVGNGQLDQYASLSRALEYLETQHFGKAVIKIAEGRYDAYVESSGENTYGYVFPDNCEVIGNGEVIISLKLPAAEANDEGSALNHPLNNTFKNISFVAENCRYALHDDQGRTPIIGNVRVPSTTYFYNCKFIHLGGGRSTACGCGFGQNHTAIFNNCYMEGKSGAFTIHGEETNNCNWTLNNCEMYASWEYGYHDVRIASYGTEGKSYLNLHNCKYRRIIMDYSSSYTEQGYENCIVTTDTDDTEFITVHDNCDFSTYLSNAIKIFYGEYTYSVGDLVSIHASGRTLTDYTDSLPFGIVVYKSATECRIKTHGHIPARFEPSGLSNGFVGIVNGALANVQSRGDAVGIYNGRLILY